MKYWQDETEPVKAFVTLWETLSREQEFIDGMTPDQAARASVQAVKDMQKSVGLTQTLKDFGVPADRKSLNPLIDLAMGDSQFPYNPRDLEEDDVYNLYLKAR